jgi:hypothetical protein
MIDPAEIPLRDIHLPEPITWWPPAPGWIVLAVIIAVTISAALLAWIWYRRQRVQRAALAELHEIETRYREHRDTHRLARELSRLARRMAIAIDGPMPGVATTGPAWAETLDRLSKSGSTDARIKHALAIAPYRRAEDIDGEAVLAAFRPWLINLRAPHPVNK